MRAIALLGLFACAAHAQTTIRERTLGAPTVVGGESFRNVASVRELSDGRVIVVERGPLNAMMQGMMTEMVRRLAPPGRGGRGAPPDSVASSAVAAMAVPPGSGSPRREARVMMFDRALTHATLIGHAGTEPGNYAQPSALLAGLADTTLLIDEGTSDIAVIDPSGAIVHAKTNPAAQGAVLVIQGATIDRAGRLLYEPRQQVTRTTSAGMEVGSPDTAALMAFDFKTGGNIPVAQIHVAPTASTMERDSTQRGGMRMVMQSFPFPTIDDWVMMPDGTLAIIRGSDLHVDWISPNGKMRSTPPIAYMKVAVSDSDKVKFTTTLHRIEGVAPMMPMGMSISEKDPGTFPQFKPPFANRGANAASDGTIWIPAHTISPGATDGYDVIGPEGRVRERIHLLKGQRLVGFGKGVVYVAVTQGPQDVRIARVPLR